MSRAGAVVRLRWLRGMVTTKVMPLREANLMTEDLLHDVIACGDGTAFVTLTGWDGRTAHVRGREVITVECLPDIADRAREPHVGEDQPARAAGGSVVAGSGALVPGTLQFGVPAPGTAWLQQQAAHTNEARR